MKFRVAALLGPALVVSAHAQSPSPEEVEVIRLPEAVAEPIERAAPETLDEIVVTGEKLGRSLAETMSSAAIATGEDLEAAPVSTMKDVVSRYGNIVSAAGDREIAIRGVPQGGIGGEGDTVSVYLDGVALPSRAASFAGPVSAWDLERVEVLRGAQSTNQGRNSLAGSVVLESRRPTEEWDLRARAGVISRGGHDTAIAGGGPLTDTLSFRISGQDRYDPGNIHNVTRNEDDAGREDMRNGRVALAWRPEGASDYRLLYGYTQADTEFGDPLHDTSEGERTQTADVRGVEDDRTRLHSLRQAFALGDHWRVEAITGWADFDNRYVVDYDRTADDGGFSENTQTERLISQELRAYWDAGPVRGVLGAYYADGDERSGTLGRDVATAGGLVRLDGTIDARTETRTGALFAEADWDFARFWRLTAGVRVNRELSRHDAGAELDLTLTGSVPGLPLDLPIGVPLPDAASDALATLLPAFVPPDYAERDRTAFTDVLPRVALTWFATDSTTLGLSYQEGYRSGGISVSFFGGAVSAFDPETTRTVEFATRSRWLDGRLSLNTNTFYTDWRDQQVTIGETSGFETVTENAGRSHYYGLEAEVVMLLGGPLELFASAGVLRSEFDDFVNDGEDYAGNAFPYAPEHTATLGLTLKPWHRIGGQVSVQAIDDFYSDPDNDPRSRSDARVLLHARVDYQLTARLSLALYGRNLTDDVNEQGALVAGDRVAKRYGEARTVGALVEWSL